MQMVATGSADYALAVGADVMSSIIDYTDRTTCVLFGDGAGAAIVGPTEPGSDRGILSTHIFTDGSLAGALLIPGGGSKEPFSADVLAAKRHKVHMTGQDVFKSAVKNLYSASANALQRAGMTTVDTDWVCAHQANKRIIDQVVTRLEVPSEKVLMNIEQVGNTSSASIPVLLDQSMRAGKVRPGDTVLMCALGAGISWGSAIVRI